MRLLKVLDFSAFTVSIVAGSLAAIAGGFGWTLTAVGAGCVAAVAPIVSRVTASRQHKALLQDLGPRILSAQQIQQLTDSLSAGAPFELWVCHNRMEAEPAQLHGQILDAIKAAGHKPNWFGGMSNTTLGIEISGPPSPEKTRLMGAFKVARIPFLPIEFSDGTGSMSGLGVWIGCNPGPSSGRS